MRILLTSTSGLGHLLPMVPLAMQLRAAGHELTWATAAEACATIERLGFRALPAGVAGDVRKARLAQRAPRIGAMPARRRRTLAFPLMFGAIAAPAMREDLVAVFDAVRPQLVVHELAELAAAPMAIARGIAQVTVGFSGALCDELAARVQEAAAPVWALEGVPCTPHGFNGDCLLHPFPRSMDTPRADGPSLPIGPQPFGGTASDAPPDWVASFGAERHGLYATFGTEMASVGPWKALFEAVADLPVDVLATIGHALAEADLGTLPANVRIARFVPQRFVLDRAAVVVSHGGAGTLVGAAVAGCTQLHLPLSADQWDNAGRLGATGAGLTLEGPQRDAETIARALTRVLGDAAMRDAVAALERLATQAHREMFDGD